MSQPLCKQVLQALDAYYAEDSRHWAHQAWARDMHGNTMSQDKIFEPTAFALCAEAGIHVFARRLFANQETAKRAADNAIFALKKRIGRRRKSIPEFNDAGKLHHVRGAIRAAIAAM